MRNYVAVVFNSRSQAYKGLHALWELNSAGDITLHGTAVIHRDSLGQIQVDTKETSPALGTAVGVGIGALLGALAGPAGAAIGAAGGAAAGAAVGGLTGVIVDANRADIRVQAGSEARLAIRIGEAAVIAEVSEEWTQPIDTRMQELNGRVYRRSKSALRDDAWYEDYNPSRYLYPYEYFPPEYA
ncbi:MAG TPA: hypothetical protein VMV45_15375 [Casimicrobiaceae bacterium]|nr:hypothetical protein [Casimicrobiaceae bacterium]